MAEDFGVRVGIGGPGAGSAGMYSLGAWDETTASVGNRWALRHRMGCPERLATASGS